MDESCFPRVLTSWPILMQAVGEDFGDTKEYRTHYTTGQRMVREQGFKSLVPAYDPDNVSDEQFNTAAVALLKGINGATLFINGAANECTIAAGEKDWARLKLVRLPLPDI